MNLVFQTMDGNLKLGSENIHKVRKTRNKFMSSHLKCTGQSASSSYQLILNMSDFATKILELEIGGSNKFKQ
jgi:hypothetical protein